MGQRNRVKKSSRSGRNLPIGREVRATRAYMAGLGTAGALVLGAAILFTLASAVVAFNGWPTLGGGGAAATQLVIAQPVAGSHGRHRATALPASAVTIVAQVPRGSS